MFRLEKAEQPNHSPDQRYTRLSTTYGLHRRMQYIVSVTDKQIRFLGGKLGTAIATEYGAKTVGDML